MSRYDEDSKRISDIQFHSVWNKAEKIALITMIEKEMAKQEQLELDGKGTGYYEVQKND